MRCGRSTARCPILTAAIAPANLDGGIRISGTSQQAAAIKSRAAGAWLISNESVAAGLNPRLDSGAAPAPAPHPSAARPCASRDRPRPLRGSPATARTRLSAPVKLPIQRQNVVPKPGVEPGRGCPQRCLRPSRLPVPPLRHGQSIVPRAGRQAISACRTTSSRRPGWRGPRTVPPHRRPCPVTRRACRAGRCRRSPAFVRAARRER